MYLANKVDDDDNEAHLLFQATLLFYLQTFTHFNLEEVNNCLIVAINDTKVRAAWLMSSTTWVEIHMTQNQ